MREGWERDERGMREGGEREEWGETGRERGMREGDEREERGRINGFHAIEHNNPMSTSV